MTKSGQCDMGCLIRFVPAGGKGSTRRETSAEKSKQSTLSGEEAKAFYEGLLNKNSFNKSQIEDHELAASNQNATGCEGVCGTKGNNEIECVVQTVNNPEFIISSQDKAVSVGEDVKAKAYHGEPAADRNDIQQIHNRLLSHAQNGDLHQLKKLLDVTSPSTIDIDYSDQYGWTALMCATVARHRKIVKYLLSKGANRFLKNSSCKSAVTLAREIGAIEVLKILECFKDKKHKSVSKEAHAKQSFYCEVCKLSFTESSEKEHSTSTVHLFNLKLKPKSDPFMIPESNIGYRLMRSSGWDGEKGLGPEGKGNKFPVKTILKTDRLCLGAEQPRKKKPKITHFGPNDPDGVKIDHNHSTRVLSARASSRQERRRRELKEKRWEKNLRQYWDMDSEIVNYDKM